MPTPPLLVLSALLTALNVPLSPPSLAAIPPSLLLLLLETLLARRLPLSARLRAPCSCEDEVALAKCVLGVLAAELCMDLSIVEPARVVAGAEGEVGAAVMALAVLARRQGVALDLDGEEDRLVRRKTEGGTGYSYGYGRGSGAYAHDSDGIRGAHTHSPNSSHSLIDAPLEDEVSVPPLVPTLLDMYTTPPRATSAAAEGGNGATAASQRNGGCDSAGSYVGGGGGGGSSSYADYGRAHLDDQSLDPGRDYNHSQRPSYGGHSLQVYHAYVPPLSLPVGDAKLTHGDTSMLSSPSPTKRGYAGLGLSRRPPPLVRALPRAQPQSHAVYGASDWGHASDPRQRDVDLPVHAQAATADSYGALDASGQRHPFCDLVRAVGDSGSLATSFGSSSGSGSGWGATSGPASGSAGVGWGSRTVLQTLIDDFGLEPE